MAKQKTIERIYIGKSEFLKIENEIRFHEHLRRYASIRRFCYGKVLDFACGCGYGSFLIGSNPEVSQVVGVDVENDAIKWAEKEYSHPKLEFKNLDITKISESFDTLVCLETIEHLKDLTLVKDLVTRCNFDQLIISFPDKKSTHFNSFHFHDLILQDVADFFPKYVIYHCFRSGDVQFVLLLKLPRNAPSHIFRNLRDL